MNQDKSIFQDHADSGARPDDRVLAAQQTVVIPWSSYSGVKNQPGVPSSRWRHIERLCGARFLVVTALMANVLVFRPTDGLAAWAGSLVNATAPATIHTGETWLVSIDVLNTGSAAWSGNYPDQPTWYWTLKPSWTNKTITLKHYETVNSGVPASDSYLFTTSGDVVLPKAPGTYSCVVRGFYHEYSAEYVQMSGSPKTITFEALPVPPSPTIVSITMNNQQISLAISNLTTQAANRVKRAYVLAPDAWGDAGSIAVTGTVSTWSESIPSNWTNVFYRVICQ